MLEMMEALKQMTKDLKKAEATLSDREARYLVDMYYQLQEYRKSLDNQCKSMEGSQEPHTILSMFAQTVEGLENHIKKILGIYAQSKPVGKWLYSICGIADVLSAGLLAHIDIEQCPTAGHIWSFAGLDPAKEWLGAERARSLVNGVMGTSKVVTDDILIAVSTATNRPLSYFLKNSYAKAPAKKKKGWEVEDESEEVVEDTTKPRKRTKEALIKAVSMRPWNGELKTLCWKIGQSFVKVSNNEKDVYGKLYQQRKAYEMAKNEKGEYKDNAQHELDSKNYGKATEAYKWYIQGKLPPAHIQARAERYAVKIFLSHLQYVWYKEHFKKEPPKPFAISILGHAHEIKVPNYPVKDN